MRPAQFRRNRDKRPNVKLTKELKFYPCNETCKILKQIEDSSNGLPIYRLVQIAIDNELDQDRPFGYQTKFKEVENDPEDTYSHEAQLIFDFIKNKVKSSISLLHLMLLRREIPISDRKRVYGGYLELIQSGMVEEFYPKRTRFVYPQWYREIKIIKHDIGEQDEHE